MSWNPREIIQYKPKDMPKAWSEAKRQKYFEKGCPKLSEFDFAKAHELPSFPLSDIQALQIAIWDQMTHRPMAIPEYSMKMPVSERIAKFERYCAAITEPEGFLTINDLRSWMMDTGFTLKERIEGKPQYIGNLASMFASLRYWWKNIQEVYKPRGIVTISLNEMIADYMKAQANSAHWHSLMRGSLKSFFDLAADINEWSLSPLQFRWRINIQNRTIRRVDGVGILV